MIDTILFEDTRRKIKYETKDLRKRTLIIDYGNIEYRRRYYRKIDKTRNMSILQIKNGNRKE